MLQKGMKAVSYPKDNKWIDMIEQPAQEPAYQVGEIVNPYGSNIKIKQLAQDWVGLSDEEILELKIKHVDYELFDEGEYGTECNVYVDDFARAIEAKLKEKNNG